MAKKKKIRFSQRLGYIPSWIKHPMPLILVVGLICLATLSLGLSFPCGKYGTPVQGACSDGTPFTTPLSSLVIGLVIGLPISVFLMLQSPNNEATEFFLIRECKRALSKQPKWRKRWYPVAFLVVYVPMVLIAYSWERDSGLRWYNYLGQYLLVIPLLASVPASWILTKARAYYGKK